MSGGGGADRRWRTREAPKHPPRRRGFLEQEALMPGLQPGGRQVPGSGNGKLASRKGDGTGDYFLVSGKTTEKQGQKGIRVERDWLEAIEQQALNAGLRPALLLGFDREGALARLDYLAFRRFDAEVLVKVMAAVRQDDLAEAQRLAELLA